MTMEISRPKRFDECKNCSLAGRLINKLNGISVVYDGRNCRFHRLEKISVICPKGSSSFFGSKPPTIYAVYSGVLDLQRLGYSSNKWVELETGRLDRSEACQGVNSK